MQKVFVTVPPSLKARIAERSRESGVPIYHLFEMAIDLAHARRSRFWQVAATSIPKRRRGRRLGANLVPVGTQVSTTHYRRLKGLAVRPKRFISDILTAALQYFINQEYRSPATKQAAMRALIYPSFPTRWLTLPTKAGADAPRLDAISSGSWVLLDAWVLLCGISTVSRNSVCSYLSEQCWRLLQRSRLGELTCMISALELVRFQRLLAEFGSRAKKQAARHHQTSEFSKQTEISWRMYAVFRSGLQIIPVMPEHVQAGVTKLDEDESRSAITIACAKAYCRRPFVIATLDAAYDCWFDQYALYKASDTSSPAMIDEAPPMKSSEPGAPYVKESTESKYARIMTENGLPLPPQRPKAAPAKPE